VEAAWVVVYREPERWWPLYQLAEKLVDIDDAMATWRHKHVLTVERIIGLKRGTGGTAGVAYLQSTVSKRAFPELWSLRTQV
jgi:tryptophan 2,3-dioxygenase